jgi:hypothetical protein
LLGHRERSGELLLELAGRLRRRDGERPVSAFANGEADLRDDPLNALASVALLTSALVMSIGSPGLTPSLRN